MKQLARTLNSRAALCLAAAQALACDPANSNGHDASMDAPSGDAEASIIDATVEHETVTDALDVQSNDSLSDGVAPDSMDAATELDAVFVGDAASDARAVADATNDRVAPVDGGLIVSPVSRSCARTSLPGCGMVTIEGGRFDLGTPTQCFSIPDATCGYSASPVQAGVTVDRFAIDAYEVTVARFNEYWSVRGSEMSAVRSAPIRYRGGDVPWAPAPNAEPFRQGSNYNWLPATSIRDAHPMNGVDYWMAQEFCVWDGGRLPTEAEWEYVARGGARAGLAAGRVYPWGDSDPSGGCAFARWSHVDCLFEDGARTNRVGLYPTGAAGGVFDLAGNVWEWVADEFTSYASSGPMDACNNRSNAVNPLCFTGLAASSRVIRGGGWGDTVGANLRAASRGSFNPNLRGFNIGFRCARDLPP
jgi:sulfatase modifying factor 1